MRFGIRFVLAAIATAACVSNVSAQTAAPAAVNPAATEKTIGPEGKWTTKDGSPIYNVEAGGIVDWFTYSGFRRYHSECHVCHGPEAQGSSYAPALVDSLKTMDYPTFLGIVASGRVGIDKNNIMPALGDNKNVMCYIDDIYIYVKALSDGAINRGKPQGRVDKTAPQGENEKACIGG